MTQIFVGLVRGLEDTYLLIGLDSGAGAMCFTSDPMSQDKMAAHLLSLGHAPSAVRQLIEKAPLC